MRTHFRRSFVRDLKKVRDRRVLEQVELAITAVEAAGAVHEVADMKKMSGSSGFYRIRVGEYRIGLTVEGDEVEFVRVLHRREIYRHFP
jgi:mRNA interferase RelE/StbE